MHDNTGNLARAAWLVAAAVLLFVYWPGLHGPLLLDDFGTLGTVARWTLGQVDAGNVVLTNPTGPLGRPLAMLTFLANASLTGVEVFPFKLTNLALHLLCGLALHALLIRLLRRDARFADAADRVALLLAIVWLLLPIQVSTVLYVVQRMTQLSALFTLLALLAYVVGRERIERSLPHGRTWLFVGVPVLTVLAALSKETGALVPLLCAVLEWTVFSRSDGARRPAPVRAFFALGLVLPLTIGTAAFALRPGLVLANYVNRDFTVLERLLTEPAVLLTYAGATLAPFAVPTGLLHHDFPTARTLFDPWWTPVALVVLLGLAVAALGLRRRQPLFAAGIGLFLAGHALEATLLPLEIYFEHRNYLPSAGLLLAAAALARPALARLRSERLRVVLAAALVGVCAISTAALARVWQSERALLDLALEHNPTSRRARVDEAIRALEASDFATAAMTIEALWRSSTGTDKAVAGLWRVVIACDRGDAVPPALLVDLQRDVPPYIPVNAPGPIGMLADRAAAGKCPTLDRTELAAALQKWLDGSRQPPENHMMWRTRISRARALAAAGRVDDARADALRAWRDSGHDFNTGVTLFQLADAADRRALLAELERRATRGDLTQRAIVEDLKRRVEAGT